MLQPKPGARFSFAFLDEQGDRSHRAVVESILSNREEGLSPEIDEYVADWPEAPPLDPPPNSYAPVKSFTVMLPRLQFPEVCWRAVFHEEPIIFAIVSLAAMHCPDTDS